MKNKSNRDSFFASDSRITYLILYVHKKNSFAEVSRNLARYFKNNFIRPK